MPLDSTGYAVQHSVQGNCLFQR